MVAVKPSKKRFEKNPSFFLDEVVKEYVISSQKNRLQTYNNDPIFDEPLVGFANGDDAIFREYKNETIIGDFHLTPSEALSTYLIRQKKQVGKKQPQQLSVISIIFPFSHKNRLSTRHESVIGSERWNMAHNLGGELIEGSLQYIVSLLEELGYQAVAPFCTKPEVIISSPRGPVSDWSEKHAAYAAGLGTFSLSGSLITPRGKAILCGSLITDLILPPTPRTYENHLAYCLFYRDGSCRRCMKRCPSGAINEQVNDNNKCLEYHENTLSQIAKNLGREQHTDDHIICGLCETKVPCEDRIPPSRATKNQENQEQ